MQMQWAKNVGEDSRAAEMETTPSNSLREQWIRSLP
jgi:hypothetical protein